LGHQTCKNRRPYNLYCVGADLKPCSINQSINQSSLRILSAIFYQQKCFIFVIFVCNYPRELHVAAATWPYTCLLSIKLVSCAVYVAA